jgi:cysteine desulfurase/selenocysteine lyase
VASAGDPHAGAAARGTGLRPARGAADFPILQERIRGRPLVWFDNAATTHKPQAVIDRLAYFYQHENSNIHRAAHELAARATDAYEARATRSALHRRRFRRGDHLRARHHRGHQPGGQTWGAQNMGAGDEIIVSHLEHHANIVPWQQLAPPRAPS